MNSPSIVNPTSRSTGPSSEIAFELPSQSARLTNGRYHVQLNATGSGHSEFHGLSITRSTRDPLLDHDGFHIYLRDLDNEFVWSVAHQPTQVPAERYEFCFDDNTAHIRRADRGIECCLTVSVPVELDCELRRCRLTNLSGRPRTIEVTSYIELVLNAWEADAHHPAFSKLFIETEWCDQTCAIVAKRRRRILHETAIEAFHAIVGHRADGAIEFETNRKRFIGRGRSIARPQAMDARQRLTGGHGPVLDPIASLRTIIQLMPSETRELVFALGVGQERKDIDATLTAFMEESFLTQCLEHAYDLRPTSNGDGARRAAPRRILATESPRLPFIKSSASNQPKYRPDSQRTDSESPLPVSRQPFDDSKSLLCWNGYGGFTQDGREYVIRLVTDETGHHRLPPQPWCNVIANELAGFLVSERGAGYTWSGNSRLNRLTAWYDDPVRDPHSEAIWIRDEDVGTFWSPCPGPTPATTDYQVCHGFGYATFQNKTLELEQRLTLFMAADAPVKVTHLRVENHSQQRRKLSLFSYVHWALGGLSADTSTAVRTRHEQSLQAILATNPDREEYGGCVAFSAPVLDATSTSARVAYSANRQTFLGSNGLSAPAAIAMAESLDGDSGSARDPCAAWQISLELAPGEAWECAFLLGESANYETAAATIGALRDLPRLEQSLAAVKRRWQDMLAAVAIETPDREIDLMVNGWLMYQNLSCRIWGRSAYYQPGGAFGFRDQLQDAAAYVHHSPKLTRCQIVLHASQQFLEGDVLHWWHPDSGYGLRTRFSDDLLWLPLVTAEYVRTTGDSSVLDETTSFLLAEPLRPGEQEKFLRPQRAHQSATVYEHCSRALDRGLTSGPHGLPLIGSGDWNDGMNRVGCAGRGESVWLGFFICHVLDAILPICRERGDKARAERYEAYREQLAESLNASGWDGAWYRRAYYDNGQPVGSAASDECQIDAIAQAWAVISGVAPARRRALAMKAVEERLVDEKAGMIRLLTPPFNNTTNEPGYIKGYLPGIRENGGQYTHGVLWVIQALAEMGHGTRAAELLRMLSPVSHTGTPEDVSVYQTEPYVVAADVYGAPPHVGRGGWTWYTGSAGWMFRVALESIFGVKMEAGRTLVLDPCISSNWPRARLRYRLPDEKTHYHITIENPAGRERGVQHASVDGAPLEIENESARVPLMYDGGDHNVILRL